MINSVAIILEEARKQARKAQQKVKAIEALMEFLPNHLNKGFTVADIRKEYPDASPAVLGHLLTHEWKLGATIDVIPRGATIHCAPFSIFNYRTRQMDQYDSYTANLYILRELREG